MIPDGAVRRKGTGSAAGSVVTGQGKMISNYRRGDLEFFIIRVVRHWHRLPREVVVPHPYRHPRSGWTEL